MIVHNIVYICLIIFKYFHFCFFFDTCIKVNGLEITYIDHHFYRNYESYRSIYCVHRKITNLYRCIKDKRDLKLGLFFRKTLDRSL